MSGTHRVVVTREGDDWLADVPGLPGAHTEAGNLESLDRNVREVIALVLDLPDGAESGLDLAWDYSTGDEDLDRQLADLRAGRRAVDEQRAVVEAQTAAWAPTLAARYSVRDAAMLLGVSRARVQQLVR